eukprot:scaffold38200_cov17-Tisochrysis_lutea.AAC.1
MSAGCRAHALNAMLMSARCGSHAMNAMSMTGSDTAYVQLNWLGAVALKLQAPNERHDSTVR